MSEQLPTNNSNYPSEIHRLLKLGGDSNEPLAAGIEAPETKEMPQNLPMSLPVVEPQADHNASPGPVFLPDTIGRSQAIFQSAEAEEIQPAWVRGLRSNFILYPAIFLIAFMFFYSAINFPALISQMQGWFAPAEAEQILGDDLTDYYSWIGGYYFSVGQKEPLEPANDLDWDGLSNMDEFLIRTNPTVADSDADGFSDGVEVINSYNFWGAGGQTSKQSQLVSTLDSIKINNRISYNTVINSSSSVLGISKINYDLNKAGRLSIPKLNLQVPIIWSKDPGDFENDLTQGVVHYPGTALPGERGTVYISGHSSDYPWKQHDYKYVFAQLNVLEPGDDVFVDVYGLDGKLYSYRYRVSAENIYKPDDQAQFIDNSAAKLNLSTCWPIGTAKDRYVVTGILEGL